MTQGKAHTHTYTHVQTTETHTTHVSKPHPHTLFLPDPLGDPILSQTPDAVDRVLNA